MTRQKQAGHEKIWEWTRAKLDSGKPLPWHQPWVTAGGLAQSNLVTKRPYQGWNAIATMWGGYSSPWWVGFKQAQALGGGVQAGEKGTPLWAPIQKKQEGDDGKERMVIVGWRVVWVWNVEQCGLEHAVPATPDKGPEAPPVESCERLLSQVPSPPRVQHGGSRACYNVTQDKLSMPERSDFTSPLHYYATLWHELGHATGHESRVGRKLGNVFGSVEYAREELVAEMVGCGMMGLAGLTREELEPLVDNSAAYLQSWMRKLTQDPECLTVAAREAQKAVDWLQGKHLEQKGAA